MTHLHQIVGENDDLQERQTRCSNFNEHLQVSEAPCQDLGLELMGTENCQGCKIGFYTVRGKCNYLCGSFSPLHFVMIPLRHAKVWEV